jgi:CDP-4-dehydro-6-deoxyglucose reductase
MALLTLRTPRSKTLQFMAGQDVELSFAGNTSRYPLASCPCHGMTLEYLMQQNDNTLKIQCYLAHFEEKQSHSA